MDHLARSPRSSSQALIFRAKNHIEGWYEHKTMPDDWMIQIRSHGWTNDETSLRWLKRIFLPATKDHATRKRLLILDGHGSHLTPRFDQVCSENDIVPICTPIQCSYYSPQMFTASHVSGLCTPGSWKPQGDLAPIVSTSLTLSISTPST